MVALPILWTDPASGRLTRAIARTNRSSGAAVCIACGCQITPEARAACQRRECGLRGGHHHVEGE